MLLTAIAGTSGSALPLGPKQPLKPGASRADCIEICCLCPLAETRMKRARERERERYMYMSKGISPPTFHDVSKFQVLDGFRV